MNVTNLVTMMTELASFDLSNFSMATDGTISNASAVAQLNKAQRRLSYYIKQFDHSIVTTLVADTANYDLRNTAVFAKPVIEPYRVIINGNTLLDASGKPGLWTFNELERANPGFRADASGTPIRATFYGNTKMTLNPAPSAAVVTGGSNYMAGTYMAADLNSSTMSATPDLPVELHEALAVKATVWAAIAVTARQEGWVRLQALDKDADAIIEQVRADNINALNDWGSEQGYGVTDYMIL